MDLQKLETLLNECKRNRRIYPTFLVDDYGNPIPHKDVAYAIYSYVIENIEEAIEKETPNVLNIKDIRKAKVQ